MKLYCPTCLKTGVMYADIPGAPFGAFWVCPRCEKLVPREQIIVVPEAKDYKQDRRDREAIDVQWEEVEGEGNT